MGNLGRMKILGCLLALAGALALFGLGQVQPVEAQWNQGNIMASVASEYAAAALKRHALPVTAKIADKDSNYAVAADSMWAQPLAEASGWPYYGNFIRFLAESAAKTDSARYGGSVTFMVAPDSLTCSLRTSDHTKTAVDIVIVDEAGNEEYAGTHTCAGDDVWEYVAVPLPDIERGRKWIRLDVRCEAGEWVDVSELVFK